MSFDELELPDPRGTVHLRSFIFSAVMLGPHRPARFSCRPRNGHSSVRSGVIFLMSADRLPSLVLLC